jgi:hypothetical protein
MEESINESALPSDGSVVSDPPPHVSEKKHRISGLIKNMWPAYLIEIFVIILGISITLALEEWRDSSRENQLENIYFKNLLTDVETDLNGLANSTAATHKLLDRGNELLLFIRNPGHMTFTGAQINADVRAIIERPKFISSDATFSDLKSSGNLHLIKDIQLKNLIFAYYSVTQNIRDNQDAEQQATIALSGAYFLKHFSLNDPENEPVGNVQNEVAGLENNLEFSNNVLLRVSNRKELLSIYEKADSLATQLKKELIKKIKAD